MCPFDPIVGNEQVKHSLKRLVETNTLGASLLFAGPDGIGKSLFAQALANLLLGKDNHPDLHHYHPEGKLGLHSIAAMREFSEEVYMAPFEGFRKVFIIHEAERMLPSGANAMLKTFEEPSADTVIILISSSPEKLLPTIISRCLTVRFQSLSESEISSQLQNKWGKSSSEAAAIAHRSKGSLGNALRLIEAEGNEARLKMLHILSQGKMKTFHQLKSAADEVAELLEQLKSKQEENWSKVHQLKSEGLNALQLQSLEKEKEGVGAVQKMSDALAFFDIILGWYRDIELIKVNGKRQLLIHQDFEEALEQSLQRGENLHLEIVQKATAQAKLSLERSTPLNHCLQTLFLQLGLL